MRDTTPDEQLLIRHDLLEVDRRTWRHIAEPGTWWTGDERVAMAAEVRHARHCRLCIARQQVVSPALAEGDHDSLDALPDVVVDLVHRVATDSGRITRRFYEEKLRAGITDAQYVECVAIISCVVPLDTFARLVGLSPSPLPKPEPGDPRRERPAGAVVHSAWVPTVPPEAAEGELAEFYGAGRAGAIRRALSLVPAEAIAFRTSGDVMYLSGEQMGNPGWTPRALTRSQIELIAARVSALNECFF